MPLASGDDDVSDKMLVVDDEPELVHPLKHWLEEDGFEVYTATDSAEGLRLFFQNHPVLTIADSRMPGMDGSQLITRIREMSDAHVLALNALESEEYMIRGLEGADDFLSLSRSPGVSSRPGFVP